MSLLWSGQNRRNRLPPEVDSPLDFWKGLIITGILGLLAWGCLILLFCM